MKRAVIDNADNRRLLEGLPSAKHQRDPAQALSKLDGLYFTGGHKGLIALGETDAELILEPDGSLRIRAAAALPRPLEALRAARNFPGNLRYLRDRSGGALVADTRIDGVAHLPHTFRALREAILRTRHVPLAAAATAAPPIERQAVEQALTRLPWAEDGLVEQETGWELRPRFRGDPLPVQMTLDADGLRLSRVVLFELPGSGTASAAAVADCALRLNGSLRHARLAVSEDRLLAEARLDSQLVQPDWLATTACAVAVAARHASTPLRLLATQQAAAESYFRMFGSIGEQPAPAGAGG
jgi:hypothetical protein